MNLVEIDLVRSGSYVLAPPLEGEVSEKRSTYAACVYRAMKMTYEVYPISIRNPLPSFRVPLRHDDPDIVIQLQSAIDQAYQDGRYDQFTDYSVPPVPRLEKADSIWADDLISKIG